MKIIVDEYTPYMEKVDSRFKYYVLFYGVNNKLNKIEITKKMFLQIFATVYKGNIIKINNGLPILRRDTAQTRLRAVFL